MNRTLLSGLASFVLSLTLPASLAGCSSSSGSTSPGSEPADAGGTPTTSSGTLGAQCSARAACGAGLTCAESGALLGRCTADCSADLGLCAATFGESALCLNASQCALVCATAADCPDPAGANCDGLSSGKSACVTDPSAPPGAPTPPNGGCYNLGGAFGDVVANGGYRCSVSSTGELGTGVDQCMNGAWVPGVYTCTCAVASGVSGQSNPSDCADFMAANTANCEYAFQSCAECAPGSGCQQL